MRRRQQVSQCIEEVKQAMRETDDKIEYQRLQCVYVGDTQSNLKAEEIGKIVGLCSASVKMIHSKFRKYGFDSIRDKRGGRRRENMRIEEERELLSGFEEQSKSGKLVVASKIKLAYEEKVGREVAESTIYRMLDRHGFRKIVPYKRHPKTNKEEHETLKKLLKYCRKRNSKGRRAS